jgi:hypothetical protein
MSGCASVSREAASSNPRSFHLAVRPDSDLRLAVEDGRLHRIAHAEKRGRNSRGPCFALLSDLFHHWGRVEMIEMASALQKTQAWPQYWLVVVLTQDTSGPSAGASHAGPIIGRRDSKTSLQTSPLG